MPLPNRQVVVQTNRAGIPTGNANVQILSFLLFASPPVHVLFCSPVYKIQGNKYVSIYSGVGGL